MHDPSRKRRSRLLSEVVIFNDLFPSESPLTSHAVVQPQRNEKTPRLKAAWTNSTYCFCGLYHGNDHNTDRAPFRPAIIQGFLCRLWVKCTYCSIDTTSSLPYVALQPHKSPPSLSESTRCIKHTFHTCYLFMQHTLFRLFLISS